jgi:folate-binding protein YgfZ
MHSDHERVMHEAEVSGSGTFFCMETERSVVRVRGRDTLDLLNRLTTMKVDTLQCGQLRETLITNEKGRALDAALVVVREEDVLLLLSPRQGASTIDWLEKYTIMEDCVYEDVSGRYTQISIYQLPEQRPLGDAAQPAVGEWRNMSFEGRAFWALRHASVTGAGLRLLCEREDAEALRDFLIESCGFPLIGSEAHMLWRIDQLVPAVGHELSQISNPLEAGAAAAVDFEKGCYIGQEVIARLDSYDKVQREPRRIVWLDPAEAELEAGTLLLADGKNAGFVTTHAYDPRSSCWRGIALLRHAFSGPDVQLTTGETDGVSRIRVES